MPSEKRLPKAPPLKFKNPHEIATMLITCRQRCFSLQRLFHKSCQFPHYCRDVPSMSHQIHPPLTISLPTIWSTPNSLVLLLSNTHLGGPELSSPGETVSRTYATESAPLWLREWVGRLPLLITCVFTAGRGIFFAVPGVSFNGEDMCPCACGLRGVASGSLAVSTPRAEPEAEADMNGAPRLLAEVADTGLSDVQGRAGLLVALAGEAPTNCWWVCTCGGPPAGKTPK